MVAGDRRRPRRRALASGVVRPEQVVAVSCTGQWASTVPVDEDGLPVGDCVMWMDSRGAPYTRRAVGGRGLGLLRPGACGAGCDTAGAHRRRRAPTPSATCCISSTRSPRWRRRARWYLEPVDYLSMRFTGVAAATHASMTGGVADRQPPPRPPRLRPASWCGAAGVPAEKLPPLVPTGSVVGEVRAEVADELGLPPGVARGERDPRPPLRRGGLGGRARLPDPPRHQHDVVDQLPRAHEEDRRPAPDRVGPRARRPAATWWPTTTTRRACACSGCATT